MFLQLCSLVPGIFKSLKISKIRIFDIGEQISEYSVVVELFRPQKRAISGLEIDLLMGTERLGVRGKGAAVHLMQSTILFCFSGQSPQL